MESNLVHRKSVALLFHFFSHSDGGCNKGIEEEILGVVNKYLCFISVGKRTFSGKANFETDFRYNFISSIIGQPGRQQMMTKTNGH